MAETSSEKPRKPVDKPGGRSSLDKAVGDHIPKPDEPSLPPDSIWNGDSPEKKQKDPNIEAIREGSSISTGPFEMRGVNRTRAPKDSAFWFSLTTPTVDDGIISRYGKLWFKGPDGELVEPPFDWQQYNHYNTRQKGNSPVGSIPNWETEEIIIE